jgi:hypothetical protein
LGKRTNDENYSDNYPKKTIAVYLLIIPKRTKPLQHFYGIIIAIVTLDHC